MAEELALEELVGEVRRVDPDERPFDPHGGVVEGPREPVLPGAAVADEKDGARKIEGPFESDDLAR